MPSLDKKEKARDRYLHKTYNIGLVDYNRLLRDQGFKCYICQRPKSAFKRNLAVDHCHRTLVVRGLLCPFCNRGLRYYQDNPEWLRRAADHCERDTGFVAPGNRKRKRRKKKS